ncbi:MAG: translation elongation factor Ts [bacterium]|nr:translation elongation factor Ts [bacterium]
MTDINAAQVKQLREETGAGVMDARKALLDSDGDMEKAKDILKAAGAEKVAKRARRETGQGLIETYVHAGGKVGAMVHLACETDFVAKTDEFKNLAREIAMQVAAMNPADVDELEKQDYIREPGKTIKTLIDEVIAKTGENVQVKKMVRYSLTD